MAIFHGFDPHFKGKYASKRGQNHDFQEFTEIDDLGSRIPESTISTILDHKSQSPPEVVVATMVLATMIMERGTYGDTYALCLYPRGYHMVSLSHPSWAAPESPRKPPRDPRQEG